MANDMTHDGSLLKYPVLRLSRTGPAIERRPEKHCCGTPPGFYGGYFENEKYVDSTMYCHAVLAARIKHPGFIGSITDRYLREWNPFLWNIEVERDYARDPEPLDLASVKALVVDSLRHSEEELCNRDEDEEMELIGQLSQCERFEDIIDCLESWGR